MALEWGPSMAAARAEWPPGARSLRAAKSAAPVDCGAGSNAPKFTNRKAGRIMASIVGRNRKVSDFAKRLARRCRLSKSGEFGL